MKQRYRTSISVVENLALFMGTQGMHKPFALFIDLKKLYNHSIIYNFNYHKIAKLTGLADKTVKLYIRRLIKYKLVQITNNHLHLRNQKKIWADISNTKPVVRAIEIRRWTSFSGVLQRVQYFIIKSNARHQDYNSSLRFGLIKNNILDRKTKSMVRKSNKADGLETEKNEGRRYTSTRQISNLFNFKSHSTAAIMLKTLKRKGYLATKELIEKVKGIKATKQNLDGLNEYNYGHYFKIKRTIFCHTGILITFYV